MSQPSLQAAAQLIAEAFGALQLTVALLLDRYGFIISMHEYAAGSDARRVRLRRAAQVQKRVSSPAAWRKYSETKGAKSQRIRDGVPDAVRGFVWSHRRRPREPGFRQTGSSARWWCATRWIAQAMQQIDKDAADDDGTSTSAATAARGRSRSAESSRRTPISTQTSDTPRACRRTPRCCSCT